MGRRFSLSPQGNRQDVAYGRVGNALMEKAMFPVTGSLKVLAGVNVVPFTV